MNLGMSSANFEVAMQKAKVKRIIAGPLATLSRDAQRDVLADLLLALDESLADVQIGGGNPHEGQRLNENGVSVEHARIPTRSERRKERGSKKRAKPGRPKGSRSAKGSGKTDAILSALKAHPGWSIAEIAKIAYPDEADATGKVRGLLSALKQQGRVKNVGPGKWEIIPIS